MSQKRFRGVEIVGRGVRYRATLSFIVDFSWKCLVNRAPDHLYPASFTPYLSNPQSTLCLLSFSTTESCTRPVIQKLSVWRQLPLSQKIIFAMLRLQRHCMEHPRQRREGLRSMLGKDATSQKAAIDEYFKHWDDKEASVETQEIRDVKCPFLL